MLCSKNSVFFALCILFCVWQMPVLAIKKSYIVYMGAHSHGPVITKADLHKVSDSHIEFLGSYLGCKKKAKDAMFYSYRRNINGFAANLEEDQANEIAKHPKVVSVFLNRERKLHTTHSWDFLSLENNGVVPSSSLWKKAKFGEDIIIGNIDTGVWPESQSFSDHGYGPIPSRWKGTCQNDANIPFSCNRKLIGARYFNKGYADLVGKVNSSLNSPRDYEAHGSHTLSTAGGNFVAGANVGFGLGNGTAKGGAPRARVAAYKACWPRGCFEADLIKAFDLAIYDGVDVLSVSVGGDPRDYFNDAGSIGAFHAVKHGIVVVMSAGNSGPKDGTVTNGAPWVITVGASTMDREFQTYVELGNKLRLKGSSLSKRLPEYRFYPLISGTQAKAANASAEDALFCKPGGMLDPEKAKGKILVCLRGGNVGRVEKGVQAALAGAVGMILCNDPPNANDISADPHVLPTSHLTYKDGLLLFNYINSTRDPLGVIKPPTTQLHTKSAPFMAAFSSKGPNTVTPEILKPDITAPGVDVIAANTGATSSSEEHSFPFVTMSGTSMSCPHVSGVVALLKTLNPKWSPAIIRSAIMTTARTRDNSLRPMLNGSFVKATPFSYGAGHIRPNRAADPGLVYDLSMKDYLNFLCAIGYNQTIIEIFYRKPYQCPESGLSLLNFNYPSITVPNLNGSVTVTRTVKNVGSPGTYTARVREPLGISISVEPKILKFGKTSEEKSFKLILTAKRAGVAKDYAFGMLLWSDGSHYVRSPIVVATA